MFRFTILFIAVLTVLSALPSPANCHEIEHEREIHRVLVVHSYHIEYEWVSTIARGIKREFEKADDVHVESFFMDTKRNTSLEYKEDAGRRARVVIEQWDPDVVITTDDNAQKYVGSYYTGKQRPVIIFCGVNADAADYGYPASNVTGVLERPHVQKSMEFLSEIVPSVSRFAILSDDSPTSRGATDHMKGIVGSLEQEMVACDLPSTFSDWKAKVVSYQDRVDAILIYMYHTVKNEGDKQSMTPREVMAWTIENSRIPVVGFFTFSIDDGALLGVVESGLEHGRDAARIARVFLSGESLADYPVTTAEEGLVMFNLDSAGRLGLKLPVQLSKKVDIIVGE